MDDFLSWIVFVSVALVSVTGELLLWAATLSRVLTIRNNIIAGTLCTLSIVVFCAILVCQTLLAARIFGIHG